MVVFLHSYNLIIKINFNTKIIGSGFNKFIQEFISNGLTRIAVPIFFAISGYLFFLDIKEGTLKYFLSKYKKRVKTLLIPYVLWSMFGICSYFILQSIPISKPFFTKELIKDTSFFGFLEMLLLKPIPYQLWFIRDLIFLIFLSPILFWLIKHLTYLSFIVFFIAWFLKFDFILFSNESLLFFTIGGFLSSQKIKVNNIVLRKYSVIFLALWILLVLCRTILVYFDYNLGFIIICLGKISIIIGILALWNMYDVFLNNGGELKYENYDVLQYSFFIYAFHEPLLTICKKILYFCLGSNEKTSLVIYLVSPIITIVTALIVGFFLKKYIPKFYYLITGGR